jgi:hypothetical protein
MSQYMVLVLAVLVQVSECLRNHHMGGGGGAQPWTFNLLYQFSQVVPATFKPLFILSLIIV